MSTGDSHPTGARSGAAAPRARRTAGIVACLSAIALAWAGLAVLARRREDWAVDLTHELFGWTILASYLALWAAWSLGSRKPKPVVFTGVMLTLTLLAMVAVMEVTAATKIVDWRLVFGRMANDATQYIWSYRPDPELGFRRHPKDSWSGRPPSDIERKSLMPATLREPIVFTYDRWGYRNKTDLDTADIALIGDSYVEGWYVSDEETAASRLQSYLGRPVANLGVAGYGPRQEAIVLRTDAPKFAAKVVVWFFFEGNDLYDDQEFDNILLAQTTGPSLTSLLRKWRDRSFVRNALVLLRRSSHAVLPTWPAHAGRLTGNGHDGRFVYFASYAATPWSDWIARRWARSRQALEEGVAFARRNDIRLLIAFVPIKYRVYRHHVEFAADGPESAWTTWPIDERFAEFCRAAGVPCLDLTPIFRDALAAGVLPYADVDTHWSAEGHDLVARALKADLERRGWLDPAP